MNARTSRLLRRLAHVVTVVEQRAGEVRGTDPQQVPTEAMQLAHLKLAWSKTPRAQRGKQRVHCVEIFNTIVKGTP